MQKYNFYPAYIWAQSIDNTSKDDFFEVSSVSGARKMENLEEIQRIVGKMGEINIADDSQDLSKLIPNLKQYGFKKIIFHKKTEKILLTYATKDKDSLNRESDIDVLLDIRDIQVKDLHSYADFLYNGFEQFCNITNRKPDVSEFMPADNRNNIYTILHDHCVDCADRAVVHKLESEHVKKVRKWLWAAIVSAVILIFKFLKR